MIDGQNNVRSNTVYINIQDLSAQLQAGRTSCTAPCWVMFNVYVENGTSPYSCSWQGAFSYQDSCSPNGYSYQFTSPGTYTEWVAAKDSAGNTATSNKVTITVS